MSKIILQIKGARSQYSSKENVFIFVNNELSNSNWQSENLLLSKSLPHNKEE